MNIPRIDSYHVVLGLGDITHNCGTNMSINGDWMKAIPAANKVKLTPTVQPGVFLNCSNLLNSFCCCGNLPDIVLFFQLITSASF